MYILVFLPVWGLTMIHRHKPFLQPISTDPYPNPILMSEPANSSLLWGQGKMSSFASIMCSQYAHTHSWIVVGCTQTGGGFFLPFCILTVETWMMWLLMEGLKVPWGYFSYRDIQIFTSLVLHNIFSQLFFLVSTWTYITFLARNLKSLWPWLRYKTQDVFLPHWLKAQPVGVLYKWQVW